MITNYTGAIYDALNSLGYSEEEFLIKEIKPLRKQDFFMGPAFTTYGERVFVSEEEYKKLDKIRMEMYKPSLIKKGCVVVLQTNDLNVAHAGDITLSIYKKLGVSAFVTDGLVRDSSIIYKEGISCFSKGTIPTDALNRWALIKYQVPLNISGIKIETGQILVGDNDGIIVIPKGKENQVMNKLKEVLEKENEARKAIQESSEETLYKNLMEVLDKHGRW